MEPEILLPNYKMTIEECVAVFMQKLRAEGVLEGGDVYPKGLPLPDGGEVIDLHVPPSQVNKWSERKGEGEPGFESWWFRALTHSFIT